MLKRPHFGWIYKALNYFCCLCNFIMKLIIGKILVLSLLLFTVESLVAQENIVDESLALVQNDSLLLDSNLVQNQDELTDFLVPISISEDEIPCTNIYETWNNDHVRINPASISTIDTILVLVNDSSRFVFPFEGKMISNFGQRGRRTHSGLDIKLQKGDTVVSAFDGVVRMAKTYSGYGKIVVVRHYNGLETVYSHFSEILVAVNQKVKAGEPLGLGGRTGRATTEHLHFEARYLGVAFHPMHILDFDNFDLRTDTLVLNRKTFRISNRPIYQDIDDLENDDEHSEAEHEIAQNGFDDSPDFHVVIKGDSLYAISRRYGKSVKQLCELNRINENSILNIGQRIKLN